MPTVPERAKVPWYIVDNGWRLPGGEPWVEPPRRLWRIIETVFQGRVFAAYDEDYRIATMVEGNRSNIEEVLAKLCRERPIDVFVDRDISVRHRAFGDAEAERKLHDEVASALETIAGSQAMQSEIVGGITREPNGYLDKKPLEVSIAVPRGKIVASPETSVSVTEDSMVELELRRLPRVRVYFHDD